MASAGTTPAVSATLTQPIDVISGDRAAAQLHEMSIAEQVVAKKWDGVGHPKTLSELQLSIKRFATPVSGHR